MSAVVPGASATFTFDQDAASWWVEPTVDLADHSPQSGVFVVAVDADKLNQLVHHRSEWARLNDELVAAAGLCPDEDHLAEPCPRWQGEPIELFGIVIDPVCQECANPRPAHHDRGTA